MRKGGDMDPEKYERHASVLWPRDLCDYALREFLPNTTPIFTPEMSVRFRNARIKMQLSQREMADLLGATQTIVCRIETGKMTHSPITCQKFRIALKDRFSEVLIGGRFVDFRDLTYGYDKQIKKWVASLKRTNKV